LLGAGVGPIYKLFQPVAHKRDVHALKNVGRKARWVVAALERAVVISDDCFDQLVVQPADNLQTANGVFV
ncbi:hypothetical protein ACTNA5_08480, partial [Collinsella bouchesdurhonensis]|uniref:hypothetical protein n=1 Tax=Collinsella bouchesdurhonensis TaxID=1907654 RepID=UPI003F8A222F